MAERCIYGVDKNPLAVEMAKLSLWLLTLAKDKPFTFLDHAIRCGDSLVGLSSIDQLLRFSMSENAKIRPMLEQQRQQIEKRLQVTMLLRKQIETQPSNTPQDIERKTVMLANVEDQTKRLRYAADMLLAVTWEAKNVGELESALNGMLAEVEYKFKDLPSEQLEEEASERLRKAGIAGRFHWPLEFPEALIDRGGFDAFVGNPPFMGGSKIRGALGTDYRNFLVNEVAKGKKGNSDISAYVMLRGLNLLASRSYMGLVTTNTIAQGDTREVGLDRLTDVGCSVFRAISSRRWPSDAVVFYSSVWISKGIWSGKFCLDEETVEGITSFLKPPGLLKGEPYRLSSNKGKYFTGTKVYGEGFVISPEQAQKLIELDENNHEVLSPYLSGEDLNSRPDQSPSRWVINFGNLTLSEAAKYPACLEIVERLVKPYRETVKQSTSRANWWIHERTRTELYTSIQTKQRIIGLSLITALSQKTHR